MDSSVRLIAEIGIFSRHWRARMDEELSVLGVTQARWITLWWIAESKAVLNQKELATKIGIEAPTLVRQLDALERQGFIKRVVDRDRRVRLIHLTPEAVPVVEKIKMLADEMGRSVLAGLDENSIDQTADMIRHMRVKLHADEFSANDSDPAAIIGISSGLTRSETGSAS
jgi:MarR family transcriptional regulator for hemolysin